MANRAKEYEYYENHIITRSGDKRLVAWHNMLVKNRRGDIISVMSSRNDITEYRQFQDQLEEKNSQLENVNHVLKLMLDQRDVEKRAVEESIISQLKRTIIPYLERMENCIIDDSGKNYLDIARKTINDFTLSFSNSLSSRYIDLTPSEIQICELIRQKKYSKEIAGIMNISPSTVYFHRNNIRKKLGILKQKANLRSYLSSFSM